MTRKFVVQAASMVVDTGTTLVLDTDADSAVCDIEGLTNVSIYINQIVDAGNATLLVEKTVDGTNWATVASKAQTDLPAGANTALELTLSDGNGMPTLAKQVRLTLSGHTSTGSYTMTVAGLQMDTYK